MKISLFPEPDFCSLKTAAYQAGLAFILHHRRGLWNGFCLLLQDPTAQDQNR